MPAGRIGGDAVLNRNRQGKVATSVIIEVVLLEQKNANNEIARTYGLIITFDRRYVPAFFLRGSIGE